MNLTVTVNTRSIRKTLNLEKVRIARALSLCFFFFTEGNPSKVLFVTVDTSCQFMLETLISNHGLKCDYYAK